MPFDFKKYDAKCSVMQPDELQREWEHYTRLISGAATSTAVSGVAIPLTLGVSTVGVALAAPAIHNARKKREIIERHLNRHGTTHTTRKRDVLTSVAISGTVGVVTMGVSSIGADALTNQAASHGLQAIAEQELAIKVGTHIAADAAAMAGEEAHMKHKKKKAAMKAGSVIGAMGGAGVIYGGYQMTQGQHVYGQLNGQEVQYAPVPIPQGYAMEGGQHQQGLQYQEVKYIYEPVAVTGNMQPFGTNGFDYMAGGHAPLQHSGGQSNAQASFPPPPPLQFYNDQQQVPNVNVPVQYNRDDNLPIKAMVKVEEEETIPMIYDEKSLIVVQVKETVVTPSADDVKENTLLNEKVEHGVPELIQRANAQDFYSPPPPVHADAIPTYHPQPHIAGATQNENYLQRMNSLHRMDSLPVPPQTPGRVLSPVSPIGSKIELIRPISDLASIESTMAPPSIQQQPTQSIQSAVSGLSFSGQAAATIMYPPPPPATPAPVQSAVSNLSYVSNLPPPPPPQNYAAPPPVHATFAPAPPQQQHKPQTYNPAAWAQASTAVPNSYFPAPTNNTYQPHPQSTGPVYESVPIPGAPTITAHQSSVPIPATATITSHQSQQVYNAFSSPQSAVSFYSSPATSQQYGLPQSNLYRRDSIYNPQTLMSPPPPSYPATPQTPMPPSYISSVGGQQTSGNGGTQHVYLSGKTAQYMGYPTPQNEFAQQQQSAANGQGGGVSGSAFSMAAMQAALPEKHGVVEMPTYGYGQYAR